MNNVKEQYWKYSLIIILVGLGVVLFKEFRPFLSGILGAFTIYALVRKQMFHLTEEKKWRSGWAAMLLLGEVFLVFLIPLALVMWLLITKLQNISLDTSLLLNTAQHIADLIQQKTGYNVLSQNNLVKAIAYLPQIGQFLVGSISGLAINLVVLLFVLYYMLISGRKMEDYLYTILPFNDKNKTTVLHEIDLIIKSNAIGIPLLAIIQGFFALIGYLVFKVPEPIIFGFATCIATIIPIIGTAIVWAPLAIYIALTGDWLNAIGLALYALLIISNTDNLFRFMLQKKMADTHPLITIFGVVIGLSLFGFMGIIFGPLLIAVFLLCLNMFKEEYLTEKKKIILPPGTEDPFTES